MAQPIVKWAGGKRQLLNEIEPFVPALINTYYEPFFGGGALLFALEPKKAVINDMNSQLINMYMQVQDRLDQLLSILDFYQTSYNSKNTIAEKDEYYYNLRNEYNRLNVVLNGDFTSNITASLTCAALFIFLNKACFNGLHRVNSKGLFNVPSAHKATLNLYDDNIKSVSAILKQCDILNTDFEKACENAKQGDFVFFDSPYAETFDTYQAGGFSEEDHIRLAKLFKTLSDRNVKCVLTNNDCDFIRDLYKDFNIKSVCVKRLINRDSSKRSGREVIISN